MIWAANSAKLDRRTELRLFWMMLIATGVFFVIGFVLYVLSSPEGWLRWVSGAFDRLATTAAATAAVSYLGYLFHLRELRQKPVIDWK